MDTHGIQSSKNSKNSSTPTRIGKKPRRKTVASRRSQNVLADARHVIAKAHDHRADFEAFDARKKRPVASGAVVKEWRLDVVAAQGAIAAHHVGLAECVRATTDEARARDALFDDLLTLKADVTLRLGDRPHIASTFGFHNALRRKSSGNLLGAAGTVVAAFATSGEREALAEAGVSEARVAALGELAAALASANTAQALARSKNLALVARKRAALRKVRTNTALVRRVVRVLFRTRPEVQAEFRCALPRYTPVARDAEANEAGAPTPIAIAA